MSPGPYILLATCQLKVQNREGEYERTRALLDSGSELSFITETLAQSLGLNRKSASIPLSGIGGTFSGRTKGMVNIRIYSIYDNSISIVLRAFILSRLTFKLPAFPITSESWIHLRNLPLADPDFCKPGSIDIIVGADSYGQIIKPAIKQLDAVSPIAQLTSFGWAVSGPTTSETGNLPVQNFHCAIDHDLQDLLTRFWEQEIIPPPTSKPLTADEAKCEEHFVSTFSRDQTGRYIVRLPFKESVDTLGDSASSALSIFSRLQRKLDSKTSYAKLYKDCLNEYEALGHMTPVSDSKVSKTPVFYLPHHGILNEQRQTSKLRVVFNASHPTSTGKSLNDILYTGAKLQSDIWAVLLRFRMHKYCFSTDIVKMYRQIKIHPDDSEFQRIFWRDSQGIIRSYNLNTVTYGLNCAPFLALRVMKQLLIDEGDRYPLSATSLTVGRYIDDIFGGAESLKELRAVIEQTRKICMAGGFPLQKWQSNSREILKNLSLTPDDESAAVEFESSRVKVLGLFWQPKEDDFQFTITSPSIRKITKRTILSEIAQLYDPLGFLSPIIIRAKIFIQDLWLAKVDWDETLSFDLQSRWQEIRSQWPSLSNIRIPRYLGIASVARSIQLHGFSDASQLAMAAVIYIRIETEENPVQVKLVCSKSKVAPLKRLTIPRLELNAALLLARLTVKTQTTLKLTDNQIFLWTDSAVTLYWLSASPSRWKDYVCNRVESIQTTVPTASWRFIPGKQNPADCASRGITSKQLEGHDLWWSGPDWLKETPDHWPRLSKTPALKINSEERYSHVLTVSSNSRTILWELINRYSSLSRLIRITALCRRAANRFQNSEPLVHGPLTPSELKRSCDFWISRVQNAYFPNEISILTNRCQLTKSNPLTKLTPFLDRSSLLRVGGRLQLTDLEYETKHPVILPKHSTFTSLVILDAHLKTLHGGTQITLAYIRQRYWIVGGRVPVRSFILKCVKCARYRQIRAQQLMGQLPVTRVTPSRPFLHSGVDYAGPISIKTWKGRAAKIYKGYLAVFVCFTTSAVHIEIVTDYTTDAFIAAFRRFVARRGICATLSSDCGTNFVGADKELRQMFSAASSELKDLASILANSGTKWQFNPPSAPHFGGKWEAAVKSTKFHLKRVIGDCLLTYEEMSTIMTQIEAVLNSRPLCPLSEDVEDLTALTPGHFLTGDALTTVPEPSLLETPISRLSRWQLIQQKVEMFWRRWRKEYLQRYQAISKWHHASTQLKEGSLVLLTDDRYPPTKWPLARVIELHPGPDKLVRVVTLKTAKATFKRPISKLCLLPVDTESK